MLPFTTEEFFAVFARYNTAIWPAQIGAVALHLKVLPPSTKRHPQNLKSRPAITSQQATARHQRLRRESSQLEPKPSLGTPRISSTRTKQFLGADALALSCREGGSD